MAAHDVLTILGRLDAAGIRAVIDGGWGIDALLGEQSRPHDDLDIVIAHADIALIQSVLGEHGFTHAAEVLPGLPARLVLRDADGHQVDCHVVEFDDNGNGRQQLPDGSWGIYPANDLVGKGLVLGLEVNCISPGLQVEHHLGYEPRDLDRADLDRLARRFQITLPRPYLTTLR